MSNGPTEGVEEEVVIEPCEAVSYSAVERKRGGVLGSRDMLGRRRFLWLMGATSTALTLPGRPATAGVARALSLRELVRASDRCLVATTLSAEGRWQHVGGRRRIVTTSRLRIDEVVGGPADGAEIMVRTLGGQVGDIGQVVHGEAVLLLNQPMLVFLTPTAEGVFAVTALAQGHYPIQRDPSGEHRTAPSPRLSELLGDGAVKELSGRRVSEATGVVRKAWNAR